MKALEEGFLELEKGVVQDPIGAVDEGSEAPEEREQQRNVAPICVPVGIESKSVLVLVMM